MIHEENVTRRISIDPTWTEAGKTKLKAFTRAHIGDDLVIDFNGEVRYEMKINDIYPSLLIDITALNKTLEQFEREYLTSVSRSIIFHYAEYARGRSGWVGLSCNL